MLLNQEQSSGVLFAHGLQSMAHFLPTPLRLVVLFKLTLKLNAQTVQQGVSK